MKLIKVENLISKVHKNLNWEMLNSEIHGIIGPSGQGKSYFLKILLGLLPYDSGQIWDKEGKKWDSRAQKLGVQFQQSGLIGDLTIGQNIAMPLRIKLGMDDETANTIAMEYLKKVNLSIEFFNYFPSRCSVGMQKRAALARALVLEPEILFLDEPTAGLDPLVIENYDKLLQTISKEGTSIVMVTHDIERLKRIANRISIMTDGKFYTGNFDELLNHEEPKVKEFMESYVRTISSI